MSTLPIHRPFPAAQQQLRSHFHKCSQSHGPLHRLHCAGEAVHGFLARRFVTTLVVATVLVAAGQW